jgi:flavin-binding protein dodecin
LTFYNNFGSILVLKERKEKEKKMTFELVETRKAYAVQFWGTRTHVTSPIFKSKQAAANYVVREGYRVVEDLHLLEIDLDKIANNENAVVEQYNISTAKVGFRMSESDDPNEFVFDSISQSESQKNSLYSLNAFSLPFPMIAKLTNMANV